MFELLPNVVVSIHASSSRPLLYLGKTFTVHVLSPLLSSGRSRDTTLMTVESEHGSRWHSRVLNLNVTKEKHTLRMGESAITPQLKGQKRRPPWAAIPVSFPTGTPPINVYEVSANTFAPLRQLDRFQVDLASKQWSAIREVRRNERRTI